MSESLTAKYGVCDEDIAKISDALVWSLRDVAALVGGLAAPFPRSAAGRLNLARGIITTYRRLRQHTRTWHTVLFGGWAEIFQQFGERIGNTASAPESAAGVCIEAAEAFLVGVWPDKEDADLRATWDFELTAQKTEEERERRAKNIALMNANRKKANLPPLRMGKLTPEVVAPRLPAIRKELAGFAGIDFQELIVRVQNETGQARRETQTEAQHFAASVRNSTIPLARQIEEDRLKPWRKLRELADRLELVGNQKLAVIRICDGKGSVPRKDLAVMCEWSNEVDDCNQLRQKLNDKFQRHGWWFRVKGGCLKAEQTKQTEIGTK